MADLPAPQLDFLGQCPDCGGRRVTLPPDLPAVGDDFDWRVRDYDSCRVFLLEELVARFPERSRWTAADVEVALIEVVAAVFDQLSDMLDRVASEATLATARRPESVRRLLQMIGFDPVGSPFDRPDPPPPANPPDPEADLARREAALELYWRLHPEVMEAARRAGPPSLRSQRSQRRMVTVDDYATRLADHPLVGRAHAWAEWVGSWTAVRVAVAARLPLDAPIDPGPTSAALRAEVDTFHAGRGLPLPLWSGAPTSRQVLGLYLDAYRMAGQEVLLEEAVAVGILFVLVLSIDSRYFRSEVSRAVEKVLGTGPGGFFAPGRLGFGEDLHASDLFQAVLGVEGVTDAVLQRFKRIGRRNPDRTADGVIPLQGIEVAVCDNSPGAPVRGYSRLVLTGGRRG